MNATETASWLRPSMLPKLALCGSYRSEENAGEAAARGSKLDEWFRHFIQGVTIGEGWSEAPADDVAAVGWAVDTARALAGKEALESRESELRIEACGLTGTADLLCEGALWSADLKTGQMRNYREQQAVYALGFMERFFADEWTVYLIYCDLQQLERLHFTREEAEALVRGALAKAHDEAPPTPNEYCGWCAKRFNCPARREALGEVSLSDKPLESFGSILLRDFALRAAVVADFAEEARNILKGRILAGEKIPGCSLVSKRGARKVPHTVIERWLKQLGSGDVLAAYGAMTEAKLLEIWGRKLPSKPFPTEEVQEMPGSTYIRVSPPKLK